MVMGIALRESVLTVKFFVGGIGALGYVDFQWFTKRMESLDNMIEIADQSRCLLSSI